MFANGGSATSEGRGDVTLMRFEQDDWAQRRWKDGRTRVDGSTRPRVSILFVSVITPLL
jgi:hypothetical protein